jgi:hypothetical protein
MFGAVLFNEKKNILRSKERVGEAGYCLRLKYERELGV